MDYEKIRNMSNEELKMFIDSLKGRELKKCTKYGKNAEKIIKIENKKTAQTKSLCGLCEKCYQEILDYLELFDLGWND